MPHNSEFFAGIYMSVPVEIIPDADRVVRDVPPRVGQTASWLAPHVSLTSQSDLSFKVTNQSDFDQLRESYENVCAQIDKLEVAGYQMSIRKTKMEQLGRNFLGVRFPADDVLTDIRSVVVDEVHEHLDVSLPDAHTDHHLALLHRIGRLTGTVHTPRFDVVVSGPPRVRLKTMLSEDTPSFNSYFQ